MASIGSIPAESCSRWFAIPCWTGRTAYSLAQKAGSIFQSTSCTRLRPLPAHAIRERRPTASCVSGPERPAQYDADGPAQYDADDSRTRNLVAAAARLL